MFNTKYIYRSGGLGDVLWLEPALDLLYKQNKKVVVYTKFAELFQNYPNKKIEFKAIPSGLFRAYLKFLNLITNHTTYYRLDGKCYEGFPKMHISNAYQQYLGVEETRVYPKLYLNKKEADQDFFDNKKYIVLHLEPNAQLNFRKIYGVHWEEIVAFLKQQEIETVIVGTEQIKVEGAINFKGSIRDLISVINKAKFFIGVDSGPSHIAASLQVPSILFFGAVNYSYRHFTESFKGFFMQQHCEYAGCYHEVISGKGQTCKLVGDAGTPKCCVHNNFSLIENINLLINKYNINV